MTVFCLFVLLLQCANQLEDRWTVSLYVECSFNTVCSLSRVGMRMKLTKLWSAMSVATRVGDWLCVVSVTWN